MKHSLKLDANQVSRSPAFVLYTAVRCIIRTGGVHTGIDPLIRGTVPRSNGYAQ